jgi:uroporphyrinogen-III decarboxylase
MNTLWPSNEEKQAVWAAYRARRPTRVPLTWGVNPRIVLLDPALNPEGHTFEQYFTDPAVTLVVQSRFQEHLTTTLNRTCDSDTTLPETWSFRVDNQNIYDGAYFGGRVVFEEGQVPSVAAAYAFDDLEAFLARDFSRPLENPWLKDRLDFQARLEKEAATFAYLGHPGTVAPFNVGFDGPVTAVATLFGADGMAILAGEPDKARRLLDKIVDATLVRNRALAALGNGWKKADWGSAADDSIQLISLDMYRDLVLPSHARWYQATSTGTVADGRRSIHLCGDATRHFPVLNRELGVTSFDTGFPMDFGALRRTLGPAVEILGGPTVMTLCDGSPDDCARETRRILQSGIMEGGRFVLREGNNLPPRVPLANLEAVYATCLEYGRYPAGV